MRYLTQTEIATLEQIARCSMTELVAFTVQFPLEIDDDSALPSCYTMARMVFSWTSMVHHEDYDKAFKYVYDAERHSAVWHLYNVLIRYNGCDDEDDGPLPPLTGYCTEETVYKFRAVRAWSRMLWLDEARKDGNDGTYQYDFCAVHMNLKD